MKKLSKFFALLLVIATVLALSACGKTDANTNVTKIIIGNSGGPKPYAYQEDGTETYIGYDYDIIAEIDKLLADYEFEFQVTDFPAIFTGINAGLYQMGVNNITKKPEREAQWLFGKEPYTYNGQVIITRKDDTSINTLEDLGGKKVYVSGSGLFSDIFVDTYNKEHPDNPIIAVPSGTTSSQGYEDLIAGIVDFGFTEYWGLKISKQNYPEQFESLRIVTLDPAEAAQIEDPLGWFIFPKTEDGQKLADAVDAAIVTLKENGTLRALAVKWFGEDGLPEWFNG